MKTPAECNQSSIRPCRGLAEIDYPFHDKTVTVTTCGHICIRRKRINLSTVFAGQKVGIRQLDDRLWRASFTAYDLGNFDEDACAGSNPSKTRPATMCYLYLGNEL